MPRLTRRVIDLALRGLLSHPGAVLAVNVAAEDLTDVTLTAYIEERAAAAGVDLHHLVFEMGESALVGNLGAARSWMDRLRRLGCRFVLDEFGAGLGLIGLLRELPFDRVKLDGSIIRRLLGNGESMQFVGAVRALVESQGSEAVASWVETPGLLKGVVQAGFSMAQGYEIETPSPDLDALVTRFCQASEGNERSALESQ